MMTQNEIQRLYDLANNPLLTDRLSARLELSELAIRAVQLLIAQSTRIRQLKALNEPEKPAVAPWFPPNRSTPDFGSIFGDIFSGKFK